MRKAIKMKNLKMYAMRTINNNQYRHMCERVNMVRRNLE